MKINIIGGNGIVGFGIYSYLKKFHDVKIYSSKEFDYDNLKFRTNEVFQCDLFIHAAGITDELVKNDIDMAIYKSDAFIKYLVRNLTFYNCVNIVYISTIHVFGDLGRTLSYKTKPDPQSKYSELHYVTEKNFENFIKKTNINFLCLRAPHIYGFFNLNSIVNRPDIIQFNFPLSLISNNCITLKSSGNQYRLFSSNLKIGAIVDKWLADIKKNQITIDTVSGVNMTVKNFAKLCIDKFTLNNSNDLKLIVNDSSDNSTVFKKIKVDSIYECNEEYSIDDYLSFFYQHFVKK